VFSDPLSVTYNSTAVSLPRVAGPAGRSTYKSANNELEVIISNSSSPKAGRHFVNIELARVLPDPTPTDVFDDYRMIRNSFGFSYGFDLTRAEASVDIPRLRTALLALVDTTFQGRLLVGER